jgi:hypothetical protein
MEKLTKLPSLVILVSKVNLKTITYSSLIFFNSNLAEAIDTAFKKSAILFFFLL